MSVTFEELLARDGRLIYKTRGMSMEPMLHENRDLVVIEVLQDRLRKYDVALYRRGKDYVLHRVIGVGDGYYLIRGDNTFGLERVPDTAVIGVLTGFVRKGKQHRTSDAGYKLYVLAWSFLYPVRKMYVRARRIAGKTVRLIGRKPRTNRKDKGAV